MANNYTLGKGEIHVGLFRPGTELPEGFRYIGNSPEFNLTFETEALEHFSSDRGVNEKDFSIDQNVNRRGSFTTDNVVPENLALFFFGESFKSATAAAPVAGEVHPYVKKGMSYQLGQTANTPTGHRAIAASPAPVLTGPGSVTLVAGTDYTIDLALGMFTILPGASIADGVAVTASYSTTAVTRDRIVSGSASKLAAIKYIAYNPAGANFDWYLPMVRISPNGDFALKGTEWQTIPFNVEVLRKAGMEALYLDGRGYAS